MVASACSCACLRPGGLRADRRWPAAPGGRRACGIALIVGGGLIRPLRRCIWAQSHAPLPHPGRRRCELIESGLMPGCATRSTAASSSPPRLGAECAGLLTPAVGRAAGGHLRHRSRREGGLAGRPLPGLRRLPARGQKTDPAIYWRGPRPGPSPSPPPWAENLAALVFFEAPARAALSRPAAPPAARSAAHSIASSTPVAAVSLGLVELGETEQLCQRALGPQPIHTPSER